MHSKPPFPLILALASSFLLPIFAFGHPGHHHPEEKAPAALRHIPPAGDKSDMHWWKGNLHTHTLWSDGDSFPEMVVQWYKENGYDFLAISDHNILSEGQKWINPAKNRYTRKRGEENFQKYLKQFGPLWVETRTVDEEFLQFLNSLPARRRPPETEVSLGETMVRLKPLNEFRSLFDEPGKFLLIPSEEISTSHVVHVNATNILESIEPIRGKNTLESMQLNVDAVVEQRDRTGQPMLAHVNHPNFRWAITAEELAQVKGSSFFEVYNGHPQVNNEGDNLHTGLDRAWDIVLTLRLTQYDSGLLFGLAVDDSHEYNIDKPNAALPGRGWVVARAAFLSPEHIVAALERGDFYASTGVTIRDFHPNGTSLTVEIEPEEGITYQTLFIGTRQGFDPVSQSVLDEEGIELNVTRIYSDDIGETFAKIDGTTARYEFSGNELYVRAKVISSKIKPEIRRSNENETYEAAWIQPVTPRS